MADKLNRVNYLIKKVKTDKIIDLDFLRTKIFLQRKVVLVNGWDQHLRLKKMRTFLFRKLVVSWNFSIDIISKCEPAFIWHLTIEIWIEPHFFSLTQFIWSEATVSKNEFVEICYAHFSGRPNLNLPIYFHLGQGLKSRLLKALIWLTAILDLNL